MNRHVTEPEEYLNSSWRYVPEPGFYDEVLMPDGRLRPHWRTLVDSLVKLGAPDLTRRWQEGRRLIHDNGITYNVYEDPQSTDRPWPLDALPLVMDPGEWSRIESAVRQRATLLNAILADIYGPQRLLRDTMLPMELVFRHPAFLRPCCGIEPPGGVHLHIYAADIARAPDGNWWVLADRTQAPSGAGYALENRLVASRVLPDVFRTAKIHRLASFFQTLRDSLRGLVPPRRENPRVVLLTPGPYNETYFEHAFLARYLGFTLVEGADLTVRDNRVYLKTLGGLLPVDAILRRQDDSFCDPLELRSDSILGVPGLVQAVRSGNVVIANALGSGLLESAAHSAFLPGLCRHILGEDLEMPTVATWWCGEDGPRKYVEENLERLVVKPAFPAPEDEPVFAAALSAAERRKLLDRLRSAPGRYVAQEQVSLSTVPVWEDGRLEPRHLVVRVYAVASGGSYVVMPGGLTRVTSSLDSLVVSIQRGGGSKDTWVEADAAASEVSMLRPPSVQLAVSRATFDLPSRVADDLYWLGRYVERVEPAVRVARAILRRLTQESDAASAAGVNIGLEVLKVLGHVPAVKNERVPVPAERAVLAMTYDSDSPTSLAWSLHNVRRVAWLLRDRVSADAWRILNRLDQQFSAPAPAPALRTSAALELLDQAVITTSAFSGLVLDGMTRGDGWRFLDIGRRLERALQMVELLRSGLVLAGAAGDGQLEALLEMADSALTYRSRYLTSMQTDLVLDLLLVDEANPRSVAFQMVRLMDHVEQLPETKALIRRPDEARAALGMLTMVQLAEVRELVRPDRAGRLGNLDILLTRLGVELQRLSDTLSRVYFTHAVASRQMNAP